MGEGYVNFNLRLASIFRRARLRGRGDSGAVRGGQRCQPAASARNHRACAHYALNDKLKRIFYYPAIGAMPRTARPRPSCQHAQLELFSLRSSSVENSW